MPPAKKVIDLTGRRCQQVACREPATRIVRKTNRLGRNQTMILCAACADGKNGHRLRKA